MIVKKMNITTAKVIKLKLPVSVPGGPEKTCPKKTRRGKKDRKSGTGQAIEDIPDKDYNFLGNDKFSNLYERLLHERKLKSRYLERHIYERVLKSEPFIENQSEHISKLFLHQSVEKRKFIHCDF